MSIKMSESLFISACLKTLVRVLAEITIWTGKSILVVGFYVVLGAISKLISLFKFTWNKVRMAIINHDIYVDPDKEQAVLHEFMSTSYALEEASEKMKGYSTSNYDHIKDELKKYLQGLLGILKRSTSYYQAEVNSGTFTRPRNDPNDPNYDPLSLRSYITSDMQSAKSIVDIANTIINKIKSFAQAAWKLLAPAASDVNRVAIIAKGLAIIFINLLQLLNKAVGVGLNIAENALKGEEIISDTEKLVELIKRIDPSTIIDPETVRYIYNAYEPLFNRLKYIWSHPGQVLEDLIHTLKNGSSDPSHIQQNGVSTAHVYDDRGQIDPSKLPKPVNAREMREQLLKRMHSNDAANGNSWFTNSSRSMSDSIMDSDMGDNSEVADKMDADYSQKLMDAHGGNHDSGTGYDPQPLPTQWS